MSPDGGNLVGGCASVGVGVCKRELMPFSNFAVRYALGRKRVGYVAVL